MSFETSLTHFPIHRIEVELVKSTDERGLDKFTHSTKLVTRLSNIDIKKLVAKEILDTYGEDFDLVPLVRKYITGMATLHNKTRKLIRPVYKNIFEALDSIIFKGKIAGPELHNQQLVTVGDTNKTEFPIDCLLHIKDITKILRSDFIIRNHNIIFNKS